MTIESFLTAWGRLTPTGCIEFTGYVTPQGYGKVRYEQDDWWAHRLALHLAGEALIKGLVAMHSCDVRHCINPEHLHQGTHSENSRDMVVKGRHNVEARSKGGKASWGAYPEQANDAGKRGRHNRWHVNRGIYKAGCELCSLARSSYTSKGDHQK